MLISRIKWLFSLIKQRGIFGAFRKLKKELYHKSVWNVMQLPIAYSPRHKNNEINNILICPIQLIDKKTIETLVEFWPDSFPKMSKESLIKQFETRISNGINGYCLKENNIAIGALWYDLNEPHLIGSEFSLKLNDKVVRNIFISPKYQGRKLGIKLLTESILIERSKGTRNIYALVFPSRKASINTFLSLGFKNIGKVYSCTKLFKTHNTFTRK